MTKLIEKFTFSRNVLGRSTEISTERALEYIAMVGTGLDTVAYRQLQKGQANDIAALANYTGLFESLTGGGYGPTKLSEEFVGLTQENPQDTWQWLITRSLWHYVAPSGTPTEFNKLATSLGVSISFFHLLIGLISHLNTLGDAERFLYFHELCIALGQDKNWSMGPASLFIEVLKLRDSGVVDRNRSLLGDLEDEFNISRDNLSTVINKAFGQTGLFEYIKEDGRAVGIAIRQSLSEVLQLRIRHILDTPIDHVDPVSDWQNFIAYHDNDLPLQVEPSEETMRQNYRPLNGFAPDLAGLCKDAHTDFTDAGLNFDSSFIKRFLASCITKRFVILTGLSGSGKTKLAEAIATWLTDHPALNRNPFNPGSTVSGTRASYTVVESNDIAVVLAPSMAVGDDPEKLTTIPMSLIREWADTIITCEFDSTTSPREIREQVAQTTLHDSQINSFESHLKACAIALLESQPDRDRESFYKLIPVGPNWNSGEYVLGYADGLNPDKYVRTPALDIILSADSNPAIPHFLILDEMNLSHVERYFAEILSSIETEQPIELFSDPVCKEKDGVPALLNNLPDNLFIIGTVNVDETTFLFSPKVLDRANVIEFRVSRQDISNFLLAPADVNLSSLAGKGAKYTKPLLDSCRRGGNMPQEITNKLRQELDLLFVVLERYGSEFGYRVANEVSRFVANFFNLSDGQDVFYESLDSQVLQKILPKLHGSQKNLTPILQAIGVIASMERIWSSNGEDPEILENFDEISTAAIDAMESNTNNPFGDSATDLVLPMTFEKCKRMTDRLKRNGFTSFAEA